MRFGWRDLPNASHRAAVAGIVALVVCAIGAVFDARAFFAAWLANWLFVLGIALAAMVFVMIHELTGGHWGLVLRAPLEAAMLTLPLCALLALPLAFALPLLFEWARPEAVAASEILQHKRWFLNVPAFLVRNAIWLAAWIVLALALGRRLGRANAEDARARRRLSVAGLLVYLFTVTLFAYDWVASLVADWNSTAVGVRLGAAQCVAAVAFGAAFAALARWGMGGRPSRQPSPRERREGAAASRSAQGEGAVRAGGVPAEGAIAALPPATPRDLQDFGNLLLTVTMFWAYIAFMQFFIVWGEDLPKGASWYLPRMQTSWVALAVTVVALDFVVPFIAMLFRAVKRNPLALAAVCLLALAGQWLDCVWLTLPSLRPAGFALGWMDFGVLIAQGGLWLAVFFAIVDRLPVTLAPVAAGEARAHG